METFLQTHFLALVLFLFTMAFLAGFIDAIAGGGGLISLPALMYSGLPVAVVLGTNKFQNAFGMMIATYKYYKNGMINFKIIYKGLLSGLVGASVGAVTLMYIPNDFMRYIVPVLLLFVFFVNLFNKSLGIHPGKRKMSEKLFFLIFGFGLGFYDAFFGPGIGNLWIMAIVYFLGYTFKDAAGYAKLLNLKSNLFALGFFLFYGKVNFMLGIIMAVGQLIGSYFGSHIVIAKGSHIVRPFFIITVGCNLAVLFYNVLFK